MLSSTVKVGQRYLYNNYRIEEVIEIDNYTAKVKVIQCLSKTDYAIGNMYDESMKGSEWILLVGQERPED